MIKNIIFDLGGVILKHKKYLTEKILSNIFGFPEEVIIPIWKVYKPRIMKGEINTHSFLNQLKEEFKSSKSLEELISGWKELYKKEAEINHELLDLVEQLKKNYKVYLFTDIIDVHDEYNRTRNIYDRFHRVLRSFEEKLSKTDINSFKNLLTKLEAKAEECLFIDDTKAHTLRAFQFGIKTIVFKDLNQLKKSLETLGIIK